MLAVKISEPGGPEVLKPVDRPQPVPGPGEVLVRVSAAGVNRPDILQRLGRYPPPPGAPPDIPGLEIAGVIAALGPPIDGVGSRWNVGDAVCALVSGGGYAEVPRRTRAAMPSRAGCARLHIGRRVARDLFHGLDESVPASAIAERRDRARARRVERHRNNRDPTGARRRGDGLCDGRLAGQVRGVRTSGCGARDQLPDA